MNFIISQVSLSVFSLSVCMMCASVRGERGSQREGEREIASRWQLSPLVSVFFFSWFCGADFVSNFNFCFAFPRRYLSCISICVYTPCPALAPSPCLQSTACPVSRLGLHLHLQPPPACKIRSYRASFRGPRNSQYLFCFWWQLATTFPFPFPSSPSPFPFCCFSGLSFVDFRFVY